MAEDLIRYDILAQEALRGVVRKVLSEVAKTGLPGDPVMSFSVELSLMAGSLGLSPPIYTDFMAFAAMAPSACDAAMSQISPGAIFIAARPAYIETARKSYGDKLSS